MKIRQFLKLTRIKILIFIILIIIEFIYYTWSAAIFCPVSACARAKIYQTVEAMQNSSTNVVECNTCYSVPWESCISRCGEPDTMTSVMIAVYPVAFLILLFVAPYILSCFIVWIYYRSKK